MIYSITDGSGKELPTVQASPYHTIVGRVLVLANHTPLPEPTAALCIGVEGETGDAKSHLVQSSSPARAGLFLRLAGVEDFDGLRIDGPPRRPLLRCRVDCDHVFFLVASFGAWILGDPHAAAAVDPPAGHSTVR